MSRTERLLAMQWILRTVVLLLVFVVLLALFGCTPVKPQPVIPQVVTQTVTKYVAIPDELTQPCPIEQPLSRTVAEAVRIARARKDALVECNKQLEAIRSIGK